MARSDTKERRVKAAVKKVLESYPESYWFMPVPYGYGPSTVDFIICHYGTFIGIETKRPGEVPTDRQRMILNQIERAGGKSFVIDGTDKCGPLEAYLRQVKQDATSSSQSEAQDVWSAVRRKHSELISNSPPDGLWQRIAHPAAAPPDGDVPVKKARVRRAKSYSNSLRLARGETVQVPDGNVRIVDTRTKGIRPKRDGDGQD